MDILRVEQLNSIPVYYILACDHPFMICNHSHWRRLVKNIRWANQNIGGGQKVVKSDYWGHVPGVPPKSTPKIILSCDSLKIKRKYYFYKLARRSEGPATP